MRSDAMLPYREPGPAAPEEQNRYVEGRVVGATAVGLTFRVMDWDGGKHVFGPAPYPQGVPAPAGARCLVLFLGSGIDKPWVIGVWP